MSTGISEKTEDWQRCWDLSKAMLDDKKVPLDLTAAREALALALIGWRACLEELKSRDLAEFEKGFHE